MSNQSVTGIDLFQVEIRGVSQLAFSCLFLDGCVVSKSPYLRHDLPDQRWDGMDVRGQLRPSSLAPSLLGGVDSFVTARWQ